MSIRVRAAWAALLPLVVFALHASAFEAWIVDDAGISYSYARSLAHGDGLIAQGGSPPVEGFSNALWVLLLATVSFVGGFHPVHTVKILATALVGISFLLLSFSIVKGWGRSPLPVGLALATSAALTPFVVWTVSGLENALYVCLLSILAAISLATGCRGSTSLRDALLFAVVCFLLFLTRPDGLLYVVLPPYFIGLVGSREERPQRLVAGYGLLFILFFLITTVGRIAYFHDVLPNTYYAKAGPQWQLTAGLLDSLGVVIGGLVFAVVVAMLLLVGIALCFHVAERLRANGVVCSPLLVMATYSLTAYVVFELLPTDWMPDFRFATPLFLFVPLLILEIVRSVAKISVPERKDLTQSIAGVVLVVLASVYSAEQTRSFLRAPTVPFQDVRELSVSLARFADGLGLDRAVVLLPDIGGSLWEDRFDVIDLAGLTDKTIGRTFVRERNAFLDHLRKRPPDLVWIHGNWKKRAGLEEHSWFRSEYAVCSSAASIGREDGVLYVKKDLAKTGHCRGLRS